MAALIRYVEVHPPTGFPERLWGDGAQSEVVDAFLRAARSVTELYSQALETQSAERPRSWLRLGCGEQPRAGMVSCRVVSKKFDWEMGGIGVPVDLLDLTTHQRAELVLACVHGSILRLAQVRGWDRRQLEACRRHVVVADYVYRWDGPWKNAPGRRHRARCRYHLTPDGYGRTRVEVEARRPDGGHDVVAVSDEAVAFSTSKGFERSSKTLRWNSAGELEVTPYCGLGTFFYSGRLRMWDDGGGDAWRSEVRDDVTVRSVAPGRAGTAMPRVEVLADEDVEPRIVVDSEALAAEPQLAQLADHRGVAWWSDSGVRELRVKLAAPTSSGPTVRLVLRGDRLSAAITPGGLDELVDAVRARTGLGPHPAALGTVPEVTRLPATGDPRWRRWVRDVSDRPHFQNAPFSLGWASGEASPGHADDFMYQSAWDSMMQDPVWFAWFEAHAAALHRGFSMITFGDRDKLSVRRQPRSAGVYVHVPMAELRASTEPIAYLRTVLHASLVALAEVVSIEAPPNMPD